MQKKQPQRLQSSGLNNTFHGQSLSFVDYVHLMQSIVAHTRTDLTLSNHDRVILANSPYEWRPPHLSKPARGVLLTHGLFDSPYILSNIAKYFLSKGFLVRGILLPGHGTVPGDLLNTEYHSWLKAVQYGIDSFANEVDQIYLAGFSLGCALSLHEWAHRPEIKKLIFFSPAFKIRSRLTALAPLFKRMVPLTRAYPWVRTEKDDDQMKYSSICWNAIYQANTLINEVNPLKIAESLTLPTFMAMSESDSTVDSDAVLKFFDTHQHPDSRLILYGNKSNTLNDSRIEVRPSAYPTEHIIDFSHVCVPIPPSDPHYGKNGDYHALQGLYHSAKKEIRWGEESARNIRKYQLHRLSYNPDYDNMLLRLDKFLG